MPGLPNGFSNLNSDQVTMTGAALQLPEFLASEVVLTALKANLDPIYVGPQGVTSGNGLEIAPGSSITLHIGHTGSIWAIGNSGDKLSFIAAY